MFVSSHVGITKNDLADMMAANTLRIVRTRQDGIPVQLSGVRSKVTESLRDIWRKAKPETDIEGSSTGRVELIWESENYGQDQSNVK